jgi:probable HAF family extracellular repeat protein
MICAVVTVAFAKARGGLSYNIQPIDTGVADGQLTINRINASGDVVGSGQTPATASSAFLWQDGQIQSLPLSGNQVEWATGINDASTVVGMIIKNDTSQNGYVWNGREVQILPGTGGNASTPTVINNAGEIAGSTNTPNGPRATTWNSGKPSDLGIIEDSWVNAIDDHGDVAGDESVGKTTRAFLEQNGKVLTLPSLGGPTDHVSDMNNQAEVIGTSVSDNQQHAVIWKDGKISTLAAATGFSQSLGFGVNDSGLVVGTSTNGNQIHDATLWDDGTPMDLNSLLPANSGWTLSYADAINNHGQIAGVGSLHGVQQGFLLSPSPQAIPLPSPGWMGIITLPILGIAMRRMRRIQVG